jgi:hypothetical protein
VLICWQRTLDEENECAASFRARLQALNRKPRFGGILLQNLCRFLDARLRGNDVMPVETGIQRGEGLPLATRAQISYMSLTF